jgi:hypothetical protein
MLVSDLDLFESITEAADEFAEERKAIRQYDAGFSREEADRLGMLDSIEWRTACFVRHVKGMDPFDRRKAFVDLVRKKQGDKSADILIEALKRARAK